MSLARPVAPCGRVAEPHRESRRVGHIAKCHGLVRAKPTAFGRATLEGSADPARFLWAWRHLVNLAFATSRGTGHASRRGCWENLPVSESGRARWKPVPAGGASPILPSAGKHRFPASAPAGPSGRCLAPLWGASQSHGLWPWYFTKVGPKAGREESGRVGELRPGRPLHETFEAESG